MNQTELELKEYQLALDLYRFALEVAELRITLLKLTLSYCQQGQPFTARYPDFSFSRQ